MGRCCPRTHLEMARLQGKSLSPHPLLRAWATIALLRACFLERPRHRVAKVPYVDIYILAGRPMAVDREFVYISFMCI